MKVVALIKAVPDLSQSRYSRSERRLQEKGARIMPPVCENVLETIRQLKESGKEVQTAGLLLGLKAEETVLRKAIAFGLDQACLVLGESEHFDAQVKAKALSRALEKMGVPDVLVVGGSSGSGNGGQVGLRVAELLGFEDASSVQEALTPGSKRVLVIEQGANQPRIPNVMAVMKAGSKEMATIKIEEILSTDELKPVTEVSREELVE